MSEHKSAVAEHLKSKHPAVQQHLQRYIIIEMRLAAAVEARMPHKDTPHD